MITHKILTVSKNLYAQHANEQSLGKWVKLNKKIKRILNKIILILINVNYVSNIVKKIK